MPSLSVSDTASNPPVSTVAERRTLLVVDDEEGPRQALRVVFKDEYHLLIASDGAQALDLVKANKVDVVISDIRMFGMSGVELLGALKSLDPAIEVILLTAYETTDTLRQALRLGACDYLNKPFDIADIRAAVRNAIERRALSEQMQRNAVHLEEIQAELQNQKMLEEVSRSRGEIYASILHDINGPLTVISGFIQLMNQRIGSATKLEGEDLENLKNRQMTIARQVTNCIDISRRYLGFLRQQSRSNVAVRINQVLNDVRDLARFHPSAGENELLLTPLEEDAQVRINGTDLIQILLNLGVNAFQCTTEKHRVEMKGRLLKAPLADSEFAVVFSF